MNLANTFETIAYKPSFFECSCYSPEHTLQVAWDDIDNTIYFRTFLNTYRSVGRRIVVAVKYIFGYRCKFGHWDEFILQKEDAHKLINILEKLNTEVSP